MSVWDAVTVYGGQNVAHIPVQLLVPAVSLEYVYNVIPFVAARYVPAVALVLILRTGMGLGVDAGDEAGAVEEEFVDIAEAGTGAGVDVVDGVLVAPGGDTVPALFRFPANQYMPAATSKTTTIPVTIFLFIELNYITGGRTAGPGFEKSRYDQLSNGVPRRRMSEAIWLRRGPIGCPPKVLRRILELQASGRRPDPPINISACR